VPLSDNPNRRLALGWVIALCLATDFFIAPIINSLSGPPSVWVMGLVFSLVGCILAQGNVLAAWLAWGDKPFLRRLAIHWEIAATLYCLWLAGMGLAMRDDHEFFEIVLTVMLALPLVSLAAQLPPWITRYLFGWRLVRAAAEGYEGTDLPLKIRDLFLATLLVGASLAPARIVPPMPVERASERWAVWGVAFTVASVISTIGMLPAGAILLHGRSLRRGLIFGSLYAAGLVSLLWIIEMILARYPRGAGPPPQLYVGVTGLMLGYAGTLMSIAVVARLYGYRLVWRSRHFAGVVSDAELKFAGLPAAESPS